MKGREGLRWRSLWIFLAAALSLNTSASVPVGESNRVDVVVVVGAPGEAAYETDFSETAVQWRDACQRTGRGFLLLQAEHGNTNQLEHFTQLVTNVAPSREELWIVLVGHGTFDGKEAKFNLAGPDLSAADAAELLERVQRPVVFINTTASSAPFIPALSREGRIVVTATRSGYEENYARFGKFLSKAIADLRSDLDKDGQVSLLEGFLSASRQTEDFYKGEKRLATEHALLDDNGDGKGTAASFFRGVRPAKQSEDNTQLDGFRAHQLQFLKNEIEAALSPEQRARRNEIERQLETLRVRKTELKEDDYLDLIEPLLLELSRLYQAADQKK